jgi:hypothetical protein
LEVVRNTREERLVMSWIFSDKVGLMAEADKFAHIAIEPIWCSVTVFGRLTQPGHDLALASVVEATAKPGLAHNNSVVDKLALVTAPHSNSRMISPAFGVWVEQSFEDLQALDALLTETPVVKHLGTATIVGIRKECLH